MKRRIYLGMALFSLAAAVLFYVLAEGKFLDLVPGPVSISEGTDLGQIEGQYAVYNVACPLVSFPDEYYSGDPDRVSRMAYVVYDEERQLFLKVVIPYSKISRFDRLLQAAGRSKELEEGFEDAKTSEEQPVKVSGSLLLLSDASKVSEITDALTTEKSKSDEDMNRLAMEQEKWYVLEDGKVQGFPVMDLWICAAAIVLNVVIMLFCLIGIIKFMVKGEKVPSGSGNSSVDKLLDRQRAWLNPWCMKGRERQILLGILFILGAPAAMTALGFAVGYTAMGVLTRHMPIGLCAGELCGLPVLIGTGIAFQPDKILKAYNENLAKAVPSQAEREALAEELLGTKQQWAVLEKRKENAEYAVLGERYWVTFSGDGNVTAVDADRVESIEPKEVSGQIRSGTVQMNYVHYEIRICYKNSERKKLRGFDMAISFQTVDAAGHFMTLARKRLGSRDEEIKN